MLTYAVKNKNIGAADALLVTGLSKDAKDLNSNSGIVFMEKSEKDFQTLLEQCTGSEEEKEGKSSIKEFVEFSSSFGDAFVQDRQYANRYPFEVGAAGTRGIWLDLRADHKWYRTVT